MSCSMFDSWRQLEYVKKQNKDSIFSGNVFDLILTYHLEESVVDLQEGNTLLYQSKCQLRRMFLYTLVRVLLIYSQQT